MGVGFAEGGADGGDDVVSVHGFVFVIVINHPEEVDDDEGYDVFEH